MKRKREALEQKRRELDLREKELAIKAPFLQTETQLMQDKHAIKEKEEEKRQARTRLGEISRLEIELKQCEATPQSTYSQKRIPELKTKIAELKGEPQKAQIAQPIQAEPKPESQQAPHP